MQKVIVLTRLPGCKTVIFQKRLTTYHQTFSPLGKGEKSLGVIWHTGIRKRNDEDVVSAYVIAIKQFRDSEIIVIWVDNYSGQNKNWTLYTALATLVNLDAGPNEIILKYFEKGRTFMSCDSFRHKIEQNVYDFIEFKSIIEAKGIAYEMRSSDFIDIPNSLSNGKYTSGKPYLKDVRIVQIRKGSTNLFWKESYEERGYKEAPFLLLLNAFSC